MASGYRDRVYAQVCMYVCMYVYFVNMTDGFRLQRQSIYSGMDVCMYVCMYTWVNMTDGFRL